MGAGGQPYRPLADSSVPAMEEIRSHSRRRAWDIDLGSVEDSVTRWRALAVFGGLTSVIGVYASIVAEKGGTFQGLALLSLAVVVLLAGILVASASPREYVWAVLGAGGLLVALGLVFYQTPESVDGSIDSTARTLDLTASALELGGAALLVLGLARSIQLGRRSDAE